MTKKTSKGKKWLKAGKTYPIIVHGTEAQKGKLRKVAKARGVSMAEVVCSCIDRLTVAKPKAKKAKAAPAAVTAEQAAA